jgi:hypothetical protein
MGVEECYVVECRVLNANKVCEESATETANCVELCTGRMNLQIRRDIFGAELQIFYNPPQTIGNH